MWKEDKTDSYNKRYYSDQTPLTRHHHSPRINNINRAPFVTVESFIIPEPNFFQLTLRNTLQTVVLILHASKHLALSFTRSARIYVCTETNLVPRAFSLAWELGKRPWERGCTETAANGISILDRVYCFQSVTTQGRAYYSKTLCPVSSAIVGL